MLRAFVIILAIIILALCISGFLMLAFLSLQQMPTCQPVTIYNANTGKHEHICEAP
jgi:hypothetical protein